jgi:hypothetical protein
MTFACKNHEFDTDMCRKLNSDCIMGRKGCVLEGKVTLTEDTKQRLQEIEEARKERISSRINTGK